MTRESFFRRTIEILLKPWKSESVQKMKANEIFEELGYDDEVKFRMFKNGNCPLPELELFKTHNWSNEKVRIYYGLDPDPIIAERKRRYEEILEKRSESESNNSECDTLECLMCNNVRKI